MFKRSLVVGALLLLTLVGSVACGSFHAVDNSLHDDADSAATADAAGRSTVVADAGSRSCPPGIVFATPAPLEELNTAGFEVAPRLTADELFIFFSIGHEVRQARRTNRTLRFGPPVTIFDLADGDGDPMVNGDGLRLYFTSRRAGSAGLDIWFATRQTVDMPFGSPTNLGLTVNSTADDFQPFESTTGLWFVSDRGAQRDVWFAPRGPTGFLNAARVEGLSTAGLSNGWPTPSNDGLAVYLESSPGAVGDIRLARRALPDSTFTPSNAVAPVNTRGKRCAELALSGRLPSLSVQQSGWVVRSLHGDRD